MSMPSSPPGAPSAAPQSSHTRDACVYTWTPVMESGAAVGAELMAQKLCSEPCRR